MELMNLTGETKGSSKIMGIDLGTTNSAVSIYNAGSVPTLLGIGERGKTTLPSCVRWDGGDKFTVGAEAYRERYKEYVVYSVKRIMGSGQIITLKRPDGETKVMTPAEVSAEILKAIKVGVQEHYGDIEDCVITVPAYFNQRQINDTLEAAKLAGLNCRQILKEPTSASYIYSQLGYANTGSVLIYDLGGGTFDVTHMTFLRRDSIPTKLLNSLNRQYGIDIDTIKGADINDQYFCRVFGTYGDVNLGGDDIDRETANIAINTAGENGSKLHLSNEGLEQLYLQCEGFKKAEVSGQDFMLEGQMVHLTSAMLDKAVDKIFEKTLQLMREIDFSTVKTIVLVGGSTKSRRLREDLANAFPGIEISAVLNPDETVAQGAGAVAKVVANEKSLMYSDVLPLPIGILVDEKEVEVCIPKNTSMPYTVQKTYHTIHDNQTRITLHVFQGLSSNPAEDTYLGRLALNDIPQAPAGEVNVEVSFILNGQGRLKIVSRIDGIDKEEQLVIDNIFNVEGMNNSDFSSVSEDNSGEFIPKDDFELTFWEQAKDMEGMLDLFVRRRECEAGSSSIQELEDTIVTKILGGG